MKFTTPPQLPPPGDTYEISSGYPANPVEAAPFPWRRYLSVLRRNWWMVLASLVVTVGAAAFYLHTRPTTYTSQAIMWVTGTLQLTDGAHYTEDLQNYFGTQIEILQSDKMLERAVNHAREQNPKLEFAKDADGKLLLPRIRVTQAPKSTVFTLESRDTNSFLAQFFLDALMDEFLAYKGEVRSATSGGALASVSEQVYKEEQELKLEQDRLNTFQRQNNVALLEEQVRDGGNQLGQLKTQLALLRLELQLMDAAALEQSVPGGRMTNLFDRAPDPGRLFNLADNTSAGMSLPAEFMTSYQQLNMLKVQREQLSRYLKPKHPKIVKLDEQIAQGEKVVQSIHQQSLEQLATAKQALGIRIRSMESTIGDLEKQVAEADVHYADYEKIKQNIQRLQGFDDRLLTLLQGVDISRTVNQENVTILQRATPPMPTSPLLVLLASVFVGGCGGLGLLMLRAAFDDRLESLEAVRQHFGEEIVGQIPEVKLKRGEKRPALLQPNGSDHMLKESYRSLRSSLLYRAPESRPTQTLLVTSAEPDEGKSTVAVNLARILAMGGARVLLVDGDLRCGYLNVLLGVQPQAGLTELLAQNGDPKAFILETDLPGLSFLPCGKRAADSADLFLQPAFVQLLAHAKSQYEYAIFDSIPVFAADDATTLAPKMDGVLFVTRSGKSSARHMRLALDLLYQRQSNVVGLVFNRANSSAGSYRYYKYSKYHHGNDTAVLAP